MTQPGEGAGDAAAGLEQDLKGMFGGDESSAGNAAPAADPAGQPAAGQPDAGAPAGAPPADPHKVVLEKEYTIDTPDGPIKAKGADILAWKKAGLLEADYTKKSQELSSKEKAVEELMVISEFLEKNKALGAHVVSIIEGFQTGQYVISSDGKIVPKTAGAANTPAQDPDAPKVDDVLAGIDPNDPLGKVLKSTLQQVEDLKGRLSKFDDRERAAQETQVQEERNRQIETFKNTMTSEVDKLQKELAKESVGWDEEVWKTWKQAVFNGIRQQAGSIKEVGDIAKVTNQVARAIHGAFNRVAEARLKAHLKTSSGPVPPGPGGLPGQKKPAEATLENLEDVLREGFDAEAAAREARGG